MVSKSQYGEREVALNFSEIPDEAYQTILKTMIKAREKSGLSQIELARRVGTKQSVISRLERGGFSKATIETIKKVAEAFDMRLEIRLRHRKA